MRSTYRNGNLVFLSIKGFSFLSSTNMTKVLEICVVHFSYEPSAKSNEPNLFHPQTRNLVFFPSCHGFCWYNTRFHKILFFANRREFLPFIRNQETWSFFLQVGAYAGSTPGFARFDFFTHQIFSLHSANRLIAYVVCMPCEARVLREAERLEGDPLLATKVSKSSSHGDTPLQSSSFRLNCDMIKNISISSYSKPG